MASIFTLFFVILVIILSLEAAFIQSPPSNRLKNAIPLIMEKYYKSAPIKTENYLVVEYPNGSRLEEMQMILNPGTPEQETVVMGISTVYDDITGTETITMYTSDKYGYRPRVTIKRKPRSINANKSIISR